MIQINISQARQHFSELAQKAYFGEKVVVYKNEIPFIQFIKADQGVPKKKKKYISKEVFGMWKDRWPKSKSSVDIVNEWRAEMLKGKHDR